jgi:fibronectin type 3 domain-containing protein
LQFGRDIHEQLQENKDKMEQLKEKIGDANTGIESKILQEMNELDHIKNQLNDSHNILVALDHLTKVDSIYIYIYSRITSKNQTELTFVTHFLSNNRCMIYYKNLMI